MSVTISDQELQAMYDLALQVAQQAGELIKEAFRKEKLVEMKASAADLVTETDKKVEKVTFELIKSKYPNHRFIGEETQAEEGGHCNWTDEPTWIIDPVDGTTNFVHSVPEVAFSLGVTINKKPVIGVVYVPEKNELYTARAGQGSFLNGERLRTNTTTDLKQCLAIVEAGSSRDTTVVDNKLTNMKTIVKNCHGIRSYGSAAVNLCYVASGRCDFYHEFGLHIWDFVAAALIATEAGATVTDPSGAEVDFLSRRVLCTCTQELVKQVAPLLIQIDMGRD